jgi:hypothetical protein
MIQEIEQINQSQKIVYIDKINFKFSLESKFDEPIKHLLFEGRNLYFKNDVIYITHKAWEHNAICLIDLKNKVIVRDNIYQHDKNPHSCLINLIEYLKKYQDIFFDYLSKKDNNVEPVFTVNNTHWGHSICDGFYQVIDTIIEKYGNKKIILYKNPSFYHNEEDFKILFDKITFLKNDEESFLYSVKNNCILHMHPLIIQKSLASEKKIEIPNCIRTIQQNKLKNKIKQKTKIALILKKDYRYALNQVEFYKKIIDHLDDSFEIYLIGIFNLEPYNRSHNLELYEKDFKEIKGKNENIQILNGISFFELEKKIYDLDFYVCPPGSLQHIMYFFAPNSKGLCYGCNKKIAKGHWNRISKCFDFMELDESKLKYVDLKGQPIPEEKIQELNTRNYNVIIEIDGIESCLEKFLGNKSQV